MSDTPRTDALLNQSSGVIQTVQGLTNLARELERELKENEGVIAVWRGRTERAEAELARALRVVEAAREYASNDPRKVVEVVEEWEAGR